MDNNDIMPSGFSVSVSASGQCDSPIVCGYREFPLALDRLHLSLHKDSCYYTIPTTCPTTRNKHPCGLGSTMKVNSIVLMYPDVNQFMAPGDLRAPTSDQVGIQCPCSTSLSASPKGLERYVASGVVCHCSHMGDGSVLQQLCSELPVSGCICSIDMQESRVVSVSIEGGRTGEGGSEQLLP